MILAYDFGTGGIKAALFDENAACVGDAFSAYDTLYPGEGLHEQRPADWWRAVVESTGALGDLSRVTAIGISGHSLGVVPIDAKGNLLRQQVPIWSDSRAGEEAVEFGADDAWYLKTGCGFPAGLYSAFKLMWFRKHEPEWFGRVHRVLGTKDWINFKLTGVAVTDNSYASGSGLYDLERRRYDGELVAASGISPAILPEIVPSATIIGEVLPHVAEELGLPKGVKVTAGGVDNSCMALGAGAYREGRAYASLGSSAWIAASSSKPVLDVRTRPYVFDHVVSGQYASALAIFSAGTSLTWLRDVLKSDYAEMDRLAEASGFGAHGLLFNPSLAGGSSLDVSPKIRGAFVNLDLRHTRGDMVRAVMEGVACGLKTALDGLSGQIGVVPPLCLVGGGAKVPLWRQIYADVFGIPVIESAIGQQCAALGAAVVAGVGSGMWDDYDIVDEVSGVGKVPDMPNEELREQSASLYRRYVAVAQMLGEWSESKERKQ